MLRTSASRVLDDSDRDEVLALLDTDPVANVFVASRVRSVGLNPARLGGQMWGFGPRGALVSLCYAGANLVPINAGPEAVHAFADRARKQGRRCSSIVGPADAVGQLWERLEPHWGRARAIRWAQPVMATSRRPPVPADPLVRRVRPEEFEILLPACVAMFTEEVGVSPNLGDGGALYRTRVSELIRIGRSYARIEGGRVVFKAEIGAVTPHACQIQGVWVHPDLRGRGYAVSGMAAIVEAALDCFAPVVTLYVNDFNHSARAVYRRVGFHEVDTFMSVLF
ncbi:GNAT family N-acetyltransferase [Nonomuraea sp. NPDC050478]|jgi:predicted GNAT family acetyltransferase|uniref:GNAT family N-acetyltransferase n=1 Tax=Nonomuraea harbinensis TaxID=1286938 RepID=A0ABW1CA44_9ACTN|nr:MULTISPECIES: GNAT family N-acetyltransferase [Nonomuraea]TXK44061.1 GNAT family N-acetyltransferase [Nonomuraea sp. C10]